MEGRAPKDRTRLVSHISSMSGIPVIVVCLYLITFLYPRDKDLKKRYEEIRSFYGYKEVVRFDKKRKSLKYEKT
jgi:hypothetical protein